MTRTLNTGDRQYGTYRPWARNGHGVPRPGTGMAPETGRPPASTAAINRQIQARKRACSDPSHGSDRETPSKLWPHDSDGAAACTTYCLDNARSRAAGATAIIQHPDPYRRTTCTPPQSSPARRRATGDKAEYGPESPWPRRWFAAHLRAHARGDQGKRGKALASLTPES
jgi:hypothetical protein